jgi:c-di-GMP-binding flagellar brake protein YcgR
MMEQLRVEDHLQILNEQEQEYYMTRIREIGKDSFLIYEPESGGKTLDMSEQSSWQFCLLRDDAVYFFTSRILEVKRESGGNYYGVSKPESVHRQQRRGHVRVPCHHNLVYWNWEDTNINGLPSPIMATRSSELWEDPQWIDDYLEKLEKNLAGKNAFTLDMSGGGLRMVTLEPLERHDRLLVKIVLEKQKVKHQLLFVEAKVVRVVPLNIGGWRRYRVGLSFINLTEKVQERIIRYLFTIMRKKI